MLDMPEQPKQNFFSNTSSHQVLMAFDFGTTRIGVSVGQTLTKTASPLTILSAKDGNPNWSTVEKLISQWKPNAFIVGLPINMDGSMSEMASKAKQFANKLTQRFHLPHYTVDERLSSYVAKNTDSDHKKLSSDQPIDSLAAKYILETWFSELTQ